MTAVTRYALASEVSSAEEMRSSSSIGSIIANLTEQTKELAKHAPPRIQTWWGRKVITLRSGHSDAATAQNADSTSAHIQALNHILDEIEKLKTHFEEIMNGSQVVRRDEVDQVLKAVEAAREMGESYLMSHHEIFLTQQPVVSPQQPFISSFMPSLSRLKRIKWLN